MHVLIIVTYHLCCMCHSRLPIGREEQLLIRPLETYIIVVHIILIDYYVHKPHIFCYTLSTVL